MMYAKKLNGLMLCYLPAGRQKPILRLQPFFHAGQCGAQRHDI
jgi:hypothetical protein